MGDYLVYAVEKEKEIHAWDLWKTLYPSMALKQVDFIKFSDFKEQMFKQQYKHSNKSKEDIVSEMLTIVQAYKGINFPSL